MDRDRSLLFSLMAVQLNMATPADLIDATFEHRVSSGDDLGERLVECAVLTPRDCSLLKSFVEQAIAAHEGDGAATLEDLGGEKAVEEAYLRGDYGDFDGPLAEKRLWAERYLARFHVARAPDREAIAIARSAHIWSRWAIWISLIALAIVVLT